MLMTRRAFRSDDVLSVKLVCLHPYASSQGVDLMERLGERLRYQDQVVEAVNCARSQYAPQSQYE